MIEAAIKIAQAVVGPDPGVTLLLFFVCVVLGWAFWREKRKNEKVSEERLQEAREDTQAMTEALQESSATIEHFKTSNEALKLAFETLARAIGKGT